ncbi:MAG: RNA-directed DNA polymerase [Phenylobacterium sp.]|jgi:RNA-directed DNA polymerase
MAVIEQLANKCNENPKEIAKFIFSAPQRYRVYNIPKRTHGFRTIAQPSKQLKIYQRAFIELYQSQMPVHTHSMAYKKGQSIKENALFHTKQHYLLKMDLENFFNSITPELFWDTWQRFNPLPPHNEQQWLEKLLFWDKLNRPGHNLVPNQKLVLSVGAPSSPVMSNFCMFPLDQLLTQHCDDNNIHYTRYADDLTFSTNDKGALFPVVSVVQAKLIECFGQKLSINHRKTVFSSKRHNRHVTGITLNNEGQLSLGRERKRYIKHLVHQFLHNKLDLDNIKHLRGLLSFASHIEPQFILGLTTKYSRAVIKQIHETQHDEA